MRRRAGAMPGGSYFIAAGKPELIPQFLNHCWAFDHLKATAEIEAGLRCTSRTSSASNFREQAVSLNDFLDGLELKIAIEPVTSSNCRV